MHKDLKKFLQPNQYCNFNHPEIQKTAHEIAHKFDNPTDKAVALFYWVRDHILYRVGLWQRTASETLAEKEGTCTNCANLLVAFLRYHNIPAGFVVKKVQGKEYFGPVIIPLLSSHISEVSTHINTVVYLDDKWIKVDPSDDSDLCKSTSYFNPTGTLIEWDGKSDAELTLAPEHIISEEYPVADISHWLSKTMKKHKMILLNIANMYTKFLRGNRVKINSHDDLQPLFLKYIKKHHPYYYVPFMIYYFFFILSRFKLNSKEENTITTAEQA